MKTLASILLLTQLFVAPIFAGVINWTNTSGGDWNAALNWDPNQVPGSGDSPTIPGGGINVIVTATNSSGALTLSTGSFLTVATNGILNISSNTSIYGILTNQGTVAWLGGTLQLYNTTSAGGADTVWNLPGAVWDIQCDQAVTMPFYPARFDNLGTLKKSSGEGTTALGIILVNSGLVHGETGIINLTGGGALNGTFEGNVGITNANPTVTGTYSGALNLYAGGAISSTSALTVGVAGTLNILGNAVINGVLTNQGIVNWTNGTLQLYNGTSTVLTNQIWNAVGATWNIQCDQSVTASFYPSQFYNLGNILKTTSTGVTTMGVSFANSGSMEAASGSIQLNGGGFLSGTLQADPAAAVIIGSGLFTNDDPTFRGSGIIGITNAQPTMTGTISGALNLYNGGGIGAGSALTVEPDGMLNILGNVTLYGALTNQGVVNWINGSVQLYNIVNPNPTNQIWNEPGALWDIRCDQPMTISYYPSQFDNLGTLQKSAGSGTTTLGVSLTNSGLVNGETGIINLSGGGVLNGTFQGNVGITNANPTVTGTYSGVLNLYTGGSISSTSALTVGVAGTLNILGNAVIYGVLTNQGTVNWLGGSLALYNGFNTTNADQVWNEPGALWDIQCDQAMSAPYYPSQFDNLGTFRKSSGTGVTTISAAFANASYMQAQSGTIQFTGGGILAGTLQANSGAAAYFDSGTFSNNTPTFQGPGLIGITNGLPTMSGIISGALNIYTGGGLGSGSALTVAGGGVLNILGNATIYGVLTNQGTIHWINGALQLYNSINGLGTNQLWNAAGGLWDVQCDQTMTAAYFPSGFENLGTFRKSAGTGTTTISVPCTNSGVFAAEIGLVSFTSIYSPTSSANLGVTLGGISPGTGYGHFQFNAATTLNGAFTLSTTNGYTPNPGDAFVVLSYPASAGDFSKLEGLDLGNGLRLDPQFSYTGLTLRALNYPTNATPSLVFSRLNQGLFIWWPTNFAAWQLTTATNLNNPIWIPALVRGDNESVLPPSLPQQYFRLEHQ